MKRRSCGAVHAFRSVSPAPFWVAGCGAGSDGIRIATARAWIDAGRFSATGAGTGGGGAGAWAGAWAGEVPEAGAPADSEAAASLVPAGRGERGSACVRT